MKPDFALLLSFEGIALLRRATTYGASTDGWYDLGRVAPDVADLSSALSELRKSAFPDDAGVDPEVKLILPTEQVKFLDISAPESDISVAEAVEAALDGATPYAIDELVYDFQAEAGEIHIAAVARETLEEAESFAIGHGFLPLGFVSDVSASAGFKREPFFGPTQKALTTLTPGLTVQGDDEPVEIIDGPPPEGISATDAKTDTAKAEGPVADAPAAEEAPSPAPKPKTKTAATAEPEADLFTGADETSAQNAPEAELAPEAPKTTSTPAKPEQDKAEAAPPAHAPKPKAAAKAATPVKDAPADKPEPDKPEPDKPETAKSGTPQSPAKAPDPVKAVETPAKPADKPTVPSDIAGSMAPPARPEPEPQPKPAAAKSPAKAPKTPEATKPDTSAAPGFSSIRAHRGTPPPRTSKALNFGPADAPNRKTPPAAPPKTRDANEEFRAKARDSFANRPKGTPAPAAKPDPAAASLAAAAAGRKSGTPGKLSGFASRRSEGGSGAGEATQPVADIRKPNFGKGKGAAAAMATGAVMDERDRMTVFGQRGEAKVGGKPRFLGLILTAALILLLLGVAAFASIFFEDSLASLFRRSSETPVATATAPEVTGSDLDRPELSAARAPETEPVPETALALPGADGADPEDTGAINLAALSEGVPAMSRDLAEDQIDGLSVPFEAEQLTPEQAEARYAATGIWQRAPAPPGEPGQSPLGDVYVASIDPSVSVGDAVAIPTSREAVTDVVPPPQPNPYPLDSGLTFDENGLIEATPDGVRHPEGFLLIAGPPPLKPPLRPGVEQVPQPAALPVEPTDDAVAPETPAVDGEPDAAAPVPESASPEVATEETAEPVVTDPTLAGLRPRARPGDLVEQNERANLGGISLEELRQKRPRLRPEQDEDKTEAEKNVEASTLAVASSLQPRSKPSNFATVVARAKRNAEQAAPVVAASTAGTVAPRTVTPRIPSSTTVASAATEKNAINLRRVNLIGVYGKPSSRRALIRLANGRYKKVKVGDRIDGGRVASIGDGQLSYVKSGRNIVLRMPRG